MKKLLTIFTLTYLIVFSFTLSMGNAAGEEKWTFRGEGQFLLRHGIAISGNYIDTRIDDDTLLIVRDSATQSLYIMFDYKDRRSIRDQYVQFFIVSQPNTTKARKVFLETVGSRFVIKRDGGGQFAIQISEKALQTLKNYAGNLTGVNYPIIDRGKVVDKTYYLLGTGLVEAIRQLETPSGPALVGGSGNSADEVEPLDLATLNMPSLSEIDNGKRPKWSAERQQQFDNWLRKN
jgi:hypothetical protein